MNKLYIITGNYHAYDRFCTRHKLDRSRTVYLYNKEKMLGVDKLICLVTTCGFMHYTELKPHIEELIATGYHVEVHTEADTTRSEFAQIIRPFIKEDTNDLSD